MDKYLLQYKTWFQERNLREKILVIVLSWAIIYAIFALLLIYPVDVAIEKNTKDLKASTDAVENWKNQLKFLADIPKTELYKEWVIEQKNHESLKDKYKDLLGHPGEDRWDSIIKTVLNKYPNIIMEKIENGPEKAYTTSKIKTDSDSILQQQMRVSVLGNFQDIVGYLTALEAAMPTIHWDTLDYTVTEYPIAHVQMEFSILYEKPTP